MIQIIPLIIPVGRLKDRISVRNVDVGLKIGKMSDLQVQSDRQRTPSVVRRVVVTVQHHGPNKVDLVGERDQDED